MNESIITKLVKLFDGDDSVKEISLCNDVLPMISAHYKGMSDFMQYQSLK